MSNTRKLRSRRPVRTTTEEPARPKCECRHTYEPGGRCTEDATLRVTTVCGVEDCDCAASVHLVCSHCAALWARSAARDGIELRVLPL